MTDSADYTKISADVPYDGDNIIGDNGELVIPIPSARYPAGKTATASDTNLLAANILSGITIFGITGTLMTIPVGAMITWPTETVPDGFLERNGAPLLISEYPALYAVIGTIYGAPDASHFRVPDHRGRFPRYWDHSKGVDPDRATRTAVTAPGATMTAGDHVGTEQEDELKSHHHINYVHTGTAALTKPLYVTNASSVPINFDTSDTGGNESRGKNDYEMPIIKY